MKHPTTGKFLIELNGVASADLPNHPEIVVYTDPTSTHPSPAKYATSEDAAAYDAWFRAKVERAMTSTEPGTPHDIVMAEMQAIIERARHR